MRNYNTIFYFLFILLVTGAFASMAQNSYGLKLMGGVAMVFGLVFLIRFVSLLRKGKKRGIYSYIEPACLFILSVFFGFRVFYIYFPSIELIFAATAIVLALVYLFRLVYRFRQLRTKNSFLTILVTDFHLSIVLFLLSLAVIPFSFKIGEAMGAVSFILLLVFIITGFLKKDLLVDGEAITAFGQIRRFKDYSGIIVTVLLMFSLYSGLNRIGLLPEIYSDEYPRAYFELVNQASAMKDKATDGNYKYEEFMQKYQQFIRDSGVKQ